MRYNNIIMHKTTSLISENVKTFLREGFRAANTYIKQICNSAACCRRSVSYVHHNWRSKQRRDEVHWQSGAWQQSQGVDRTRVNNGWVCRPQQAHIRHLTWTGSSLLYHCDGWILNTGHLIPVSATPYRLLMLAHGVGSCSRTEPQQRDSWHRQPSQTNSWTKFWYRAAR